MQAGRRAPSDRKVFDIQSKHEEASKIDQGRRDNQSKFLRNILSKKKTATEISYDQQRGSAQHVDDATDMMASKGGNESFSYGGQGGRGHRGSQQESSFEIRGNT